MVLGFSVGMEAFDELLLMNVPWSQEFSGVVVDSVESVHFQIVP